MVVIPVGTHITPDTMQGHGQRGWLKDDTATRSTKEGGGGGAFRGGNKLGTTTSLDSLGHRGFSKHPGGESKNPPPKYFLVI